MIDPVFAATWTATWQAIGGMAAFISVVVVPLAILFHRRVVKPLSWTLGLKADASPTGEAIPTIPQQLAELRKNQLVIHGEIATIKSEVFPNHGSSLRDSVNRNEQLTREIHLKLTNHISDPEAHSHKPV